MGYALIIIGFLGFFASIIYMIIKAIKKRFSKRLFYLPFICIVLCIIGGIVAPPVTKAPESIEISISDYQDEYDINTGIPVDISILPEDATTDDLSYIADENDITFSESGVVTGTKEGTYEIYVESGEIKSNALSITVVDFAARDAALEIQTQKLVEKVAANATEETRLADEALKAAVEKRLAEEAAKAQAEAEAKQKAAEEESRKQAEQEALQKAEAEAAVKQAQTAVSQPQQNEVGTTVYWTPNGEVYHSTADCPTLGRSKVINSGSVSQSGKSRPCKVCY